MIRRAGGLGEDVANLRFELGLVESGLVYRPLGAEKKDGPDVHLWTS